MTFRASHIGYIGAKHTGGSHGWQLVLADLALILFLVTLTGLVDGSLGKTTDTTLDATPSAQGYIAPAQALFRPSSGGPSLSQWLEEQPLDPRATLTIVAQYEGENQYLMWQNAQMLSASVADAKVAVRVIIRKGEQSDLYASLAYDEMYEEAGSPRSIETG